MSSIYKQAPSRNFSCSVVCFPLLHCSWLTQSQPASPALPSAEELNKEIPGPKLFKRFSACTSGPVNFQKLCFRLLKLRRAGMNTKLDTVGLRENDSDWREKASSRDALKCGEEDFHHKEHLLKEKSDLVLEGYTTCSPLSDSDSRGNLIWQITPTATIPVSALTVWVSVWWMLFKTHQPDRRTVPN